MTVRDTIVEKLSQKFSPTRLEVIDESEKHRGHAGWRQGGETHFRVRIAAPALVGQTRVAQHRDVMLALAEEMNGRVHALTIEVLPPGGDAGD